MQDIFTILKESGIEVPEDKVATVKKGITDNYKTIAEFTKKTDRLAELEKTNTELSDKIKTFDGSAEQIEALNKKVADYEKAETDRKNAEETAKKDAELYELFKPLKGENNFINEYTEKAIFNDFKTAITEKENKGKAYSEVYENLTKDKEIYKNPNGAHFPPAHNKSSGADKSLMDKLYKNNPFYKG